MIYGKFYINSKGVNMGIFDLFKKGVSGYNDPYDYRNEVIYQCVPRLLNEDVGDFRKIKIGNDWGFAGGPRRAVTAPTVLNEKYYIEIESYYHKGIELSQCVDEMCAKIDTYIFKKQCDAYLNRPI